MPLGPCIDIKETSLTMGRVLDVRQQLLFGPIASFLRLVRAILAIEPVAESEWGNVTTEIYSPMLGSQQGKRCVSVFTYSVFSCIGDKHDFTIDNCGPEFIVLPWDIAPIVQQAVVETW